MIDPPAEGRVYVHRAVPGLGDVTPGGRARLDAIARWLQDAAFADVHDAGVPDQGVWIVRRMTVRVERFPRFWEPFEAATFCSGTGPLWAERRTTIRGAERSGDEREARGRGGLIEASALWVHLDSAGTRPRPLPDGFEAIYGPAANGRRVRARLRHPATAPPEATTRPWFFRAADLDLADHVNNAAYWAALEEELAGDDPPDGYAAEIEHRAAGGAGPATVAAHGRHRWIADGDGTVLATLELPAGRRNR
jgi:acyl-ACP thioesterase